MNEIDWEAEASDARMDAIMLLEHLKVAIEHLEHERGKYRLTQVYLEEAIRSLKQTARDYDYDYDYKLNENVFVEIKKPSRNEIKHKASWLDGTGEWKVVMKGSKNMHAYDLYVMAVEKGWMSHETANNLYPGYWFYAKYDVAEANPGQVVEVECDDLIKLQTEMTTLWKNQK
jgi:hypothetical protein